MKFTLVQTVSVAALLLAIGASSAAYAQAPAAPPAAAPAQLGEVVVTAQRRSEDIQKAAVAVTAISGVELAQRGITSNEGLSKATAALQFSTATGPYTVFTVRGIGSLSGNAFADPAVAVNFAGAYLATPTTFHGLLYDLERAEILKGPQGTLYGRNATGGVINILPRRPTFSTGGDINVDVGNYNQLNASGDINIPLSDRFAVRAAFQSINREGYFTDGSGDDKVQGGRVGLRYDPNADLSLNLFVDYTHTGGKGAGASVIKQCGGGVVCYPLGAYTSIYDSNSLYAAAGISQQPRNLQNLGDLYGLTGNVDWKVAGGTLTVIPSFRASNIHYISTATGWQIQERQRPTQESLEARFASDPTQRIGYVFGAYYLQTGMHAVAYGESPVSGSFSDQNTNTTGWTGATFGQATASLTHNFRLVGGLRYTYEDKATDSVRYSIRTPGPDPVIPAHPTIAPSSVNTDVKNWGAVTWKGGVEWDVAPRSLVYANVSTGFKAGGFFYGVPGKDSYDPEHVTAYVIGSKNRFFNNRLQLNAEAYYLDYTNQQLSFSTLVNGASVLVTQNIGKTAVKGGELEAQYLVFDHTKVGVQVEYVNSKFVSFSYTSGSPAFAGSKCSSVKTGTVYTIDCSGLTSLHAPDWTTVLNLQQTVPLAHEASLVGELDYRYQGAFESDVNYLPESRAPSYSKVDLSLTYKPGGDARWYATAYVNNVGNVVSISNITVNTAWNVVHQSAATLDAPRTYGMRVGMSF